MPIARRTLRHTRLLGATVMTLLALAGAERAASQQTPQEILPSLPGGPAGTPVTVRITGLAPGRQIQVGFGGLGSNHEVFAVDESEPDGTYTFTAAIPDWVERHRTYYFFAQYVGRPPHLVSAPFIATAADGFVRVAGDVESAAAGCMLVRALDDTVYALHGDAGSVESGARVLVEGTLDVAAPPLPEGCGEGPAIPVRIRQVLPGR